MQVAQQHMVVTNRLALAMQGSARNSNAKGTIYGVFSTYVAALQFQHNRKLRLVTTIVTQ